MKRYQYYTHCSNGALYRFPVNSKTKGECFGIDRTWHGWNVRQIAPCNWTKIPREEARRRFPKAFRVKA